MVTVSPGTDFVHSIHVVKHHTTWRSSFFWVLTVKGQVTCMAFHVMQQAHSQNVENN